MNTAEHWEKALKSTAIVRPRLKPLETFRSTTLPYIILSELASSRTAIRMGEVAVREPSLLLPGHTPQFEGFDAEGTGATDWGLVTGFLLVRGVSFPSLKFSNKTKPTESSSEALRSAVERVMEECARREDIATAVAVGPDDSWAFSLLILVATQVARSAQGDVRKILEDLKKRES